MQIRWTIQSGAVATEPCVAAKVRSDAGVNPIEGRVGHQHAADAENSAQLPHKLRRVGYVFQNIKTDHRVKRLGFDVARIFQLLDDNPATFEHRTSEPLAATGDVEIRHVMTGPRELEAVKSDPVPIRQDPLRN
jgi:hypothetical protein